MKFAIPSHSGRVALPVRLALRSGKRLGRLLPVSEAASALVVAEAEDGSFEHSFHSLPLRLSRAGTDPGEAGWALNGVPAGAGDWTYFLDIPGDFLLREERGRKRLRSLSVQIVGHSPLRPEASFAGQVSLDFQEAAGIPAASRFVRFCDQWLPVLLPERFVAGAAVQTVDGGGGPREVLFVSLLRRDDSAQPPSLGPDWEASSWVDSLAETVGTPGGAHAFIRGGCFHSPEGGISHWFGGRIGLDIPGFRARAAKDIARHASRGYPTWCFWMEGAGEEIFPGGLLRGGGVLRIRHPVLGLAWQRADSRLGGSAVDAGHRKALKMLAAAARLRALRHADWERLASEEAPRLWSPAGGAPWLESLEAEVRDFYARHAPLLKRLADYQAAHPAPADKPPNPLAVIADFAATALRGEVA